MSLFPFVALFLLHVQELAHFPRVQAKLKLERENTGRTTSPVLNVKLEKLNSKHSTTRAFAPRFPKVNAVFLFMTIF